MKRSHIFGGISIVAALLILFVFNKVISKRDTSELYTEAKKGEFVISVPVMGELIAEKSIDINGPAFAQSRYVRARHIKIQDLIPEGTIVDKGDYIATLDRTELDNSLKDQQDRLKTLQTTLEMKKLDSAVVLNSLRDGIKNQQYAVEEAAISLRNSKYEPPTTIRQAEIELNKSQRVFEQKVRGYKRSAAQLKTDIYNQEYFVSIISQRVKELEDLLAGFTITSPGYGMVIYKKEWNGIKRKIGSTISPFDRVVAILPDLSSMISKIFVNEIDINKIRTGQKVFITVDAFPKKSFHGYISSVANIGENLPNTQDKVFEVQIKIDESDPAFRPSMTTGNKIIVKSIENAVFVPVECLNTDAEGISYVFTSDGEKQIVIPGESNEKDVVIEKGLTPGTMVYLNKPENPEKFNLAGEDLIPLMQKHDNLSNEENEISLN